jgi:DNA-binding MarR family transcriptional regulator
LHFLDFSVKRAHLRCVETLKPVAAMYGLTPARFHARDGRAAHPEHVPNARLRRLVQALEKLGFVARCRDVRDRRTKVVRLTMQGVAAVQGLLEEIVMSGHLDLAFEGCFAWPARGAEPTVRILCKALRFLAKNLADRSHLRHPGEPPMAHDPPWLALSGDCPATVAVGL